MWRRVVDLGTVVCGATEPIKSKRKDVRVSPLPPLGMDCESVEKGLV
jgi:hypothetical protein